MTQVDVLIVGGGTAAASAAVELRARGFTGSVTMLTREAEGPYHRPAVSKELLRPDGAAHPIATPAADWFADNDVVLRTRAAVTALDTDAHEVTLADRSVLAYGTALLATGANVRRLSLPGCALAGIHYLRTPANAAKLRDDAAGARHAVLVGGSFVAAEVAASLTVLGVTTTMVMPETAPLTTTVGPTVAGYVARLLADRGVELVCGEQVTEFTGDERVDGVRTASGRHLPADLVVVGVGATPDTRLATRAGLALGPTGGIACDHTLATSAADVFAAGDVCEYDSAELGRRLRVEHHEHAAAQGVTAARGLMGDPVAHRELPYFWTDLADWARLEYVGSATGWDREHVTGDLDAGAFTVRYESAGHVVAALTCGRPADLDEVRATIAARATSRPAHVR